MGLCKWRTVQFKFSMTIISSYSFHRWVQKNDRRRQKPSVLERYSFIKRTAFLHLLCLLRFIKFQTRSSEPVLPCLRHLSGEWPPCFWWESKISAILHKKFIINKPEPVRSSPALRLIIRDVLEAVGALLNDVCDSKLFFCKQRYAAAVAAGFYKAMLKSRSPIPATKMRCVLAVQLWSHLEDMHHLGRQLWDQQSQSGTDECV